MSGELIPLSHCLTTKRQATSPIAYHAGHYYAADQFYAAVKSWVARLQSQSVHRYALFTEDAYPLQSCCLLYFTLARKSGYLAIIAPVRRYNFSNWIVG
jgi:hypothetical protein